MTPTTPKLVLTPHRYAVPDAAESVVCLSTAYVWKKIALMLVARVRLMSAVRSTLQTLYAGRDSVYKVKYELPHWKGSSRTRIY